MATTLSNKKHFEVTMERFLYLQICCNVKPSKMEYYREEINRKLPPSGTTEGWKLMTEEDYKARPECRPVKCSDKKGYYHYLCTC